MKQILFIICISFLYTACSPGYFFKKDQAAFNASATLSRFKSAEDMNDSYFEIKENNFVSFYKTLFDSVKNTHYPGKYHLVGDTLMLKFYDNKAHELLGNKALIRRDKKEIVFFNDYPGIRQRLIFN